MRLHRACARCHRTDFSSGSELSLALGTGTKAKLAEAGKKFRAPFLSVRGSMFDCSMFKVSALGAHSGTHSASSSSRRSLKASGPWGLEVGADPRLAHSEGSHTRVVVSSIALASSRRHCTSTDKR